MTDEDRERLVRIEVGQYYMKEILEKQVVSRINDHGNRIRALEVLRYKAVGAMMLAGMLAGLGKDWIKQKISGGQ